MTPRLQPTLLNALRTLARPSTWMRALWLATALLHAWLVVRRIGLGDWSGTMDFARAGLCLIAIGYALAKLWSLSTVFDANPRRALVFSLILLVGHALVDLQPGALAAGATDGIPAAALIAVLPAMAAVALMLVVLSRTQAAPRAPMTAPVRLRAYCFMDDRRLTRPLPSPTLFKRPPPALG